MPYPKECKFAPQIRARVEPGTFNTRVPLTFNTADPVPGTFNTADPATQGILYYIKK